MHTIFVREHNRIVKEFGNINTNWDGERKYQEARKIVGAILQKITYEDFLPLILGPNSLKPYNYYQPNVNPGIFNSFATAAFRFGHSLIRPTFDILNKNFEPIADPLPLRLAFFNNTLIKKLGIEPFLLGLLANSSEKFDRELANDLLEELFQRPNSTGLNLAALNIQRGRDHGLPGYNSFRVACGLKSASTFYDTRNEIKNFRTRLILKKLYNDDPARADLWVSLLAEDPVRDGVVGPTAKCIIQKQMEALRDGDRFFYLNKFVFSSKQLREIKKSSLSRVYCDNLKTIVSIQENAFLTAQQRITCERIPKLNLNMWKG